MTYRAFKLKIGRGHRWMDRAAGDARDIEVTRSVREAYPDHRILVDANDGYDSFGQTSWRSVMPRIAELGGRASPHAWSLPLKTLYAAQLAAGLGNVDTVEGVPGETIGVDTSGYRWQDGELTVPDRPGSGLPLD